MGGVIEVQDEGQEIIEDQRYPPDVALDMAQLEKHRHHIFITKKENAFTISCWLYDLTETSVDLKIILLKIESQLDEVGVEWENVVYNTLYISDMNMLAVANKPFGNFITQGKCRLGEKSCSKIEFQVGFGRAYVEVLVANDQSKKVIHVQSISSQAPCCIGPYNQEKLHKETLHMAGQLGIDPPTMSLCRRVGVAEVEQVLANSEAIAKSFNFSTSTLAVLFVSCPKSTSTLDRISKQEKQYIIIYQLKLVHTIKVCHKEKIQINSYGVCYALCGHHSPSLPKPPNSLVSFFTPSIFPATFIKFYEELSIKGMSLEQGTDCTIIRLSVVFHYDSRIVEHSLTNPSIISTYILTYDYTSELLHLKLEEKLQLNLQLGCLLKTKYTEVMQLVLEMMVLCQEAIATVDTPEMNAGIANKLVGIPLRCGVLEHLRRQPGQRKVCALILNFHVYLDVYLLLLEVGFQVLAWVIMRSHVSREHPPTNDISKNREQVEQWMVAWQLGTTKDNSRKIIYFIPSRLMIFRLEDKPSLYGGGIDREYANGSLLSYHSPSGLGLFIERVIYVAVGGES